MNKKEKLERIIGEAKVFINSSATAFDANFKAWEAKLTRFLEVAIGKDSTDYKRLSERRYSSYTDPDYISAWELKSEFQNAIKITIAELEGLLDDIDDIEPKKAEKKVISSQKENVPVHLNITNQNINNNSNMINNFSLIEVKENITNNTMLDDKSKEELLEKLEEIKKLQASNNTKVEKWKIAKEILKFVIDKGVDIAIMFIPHILIAIGKE